MSYMYLRSYTPHFVFWSAALSLTPPPPLSLHTVSLLSPPHFVSLSPPSLPHSRVCLLHHIERIDHQQPTRISLFDTGWFVLVTLSTVGYGDITPKHWTGKLLVAVFIITALIYLIPQLEQLFEAFQMQQKLHNTVSYQKSGKHIIVCAKRMKPLVLRDFLTEFYSDPSHYVRACANTNGRMLVSLVPWYCHC